MFLITNKTISRCLLIVIQVLILALNLAFAGETECALLSDALMDDWVNNKVTSEQLIKAKDVCIKLAKQGDPEAQYHAGGLYTVHIDNIFPNDVETFKWMELSANNGYARAQNYLGTLYETGFSAPYIKDINLAIKWHTLAAKQHNPPSMLRLEKIYRNGLLGIKADVEKANYWRNEIEKLRK